METTHKTSRKRNRLRQFLTLLVAILWLPLIVTALDVVIERNVNLRGPSTQTEVIQGPPREFA